MDLRDAERWSRAWEGRDHDEGDWCAVAVRLLTELDRVRAELDERTARLERHHEHVVGARPHDCEACDPPSELLDQATCPHEDAGYLDDEWQCWDCGAYRDESEAADRRRRRDEQCTTCGHGPASHAPNGGGCYQCPDSGPRWCDTGYRPTGDAS